MPTNEERLATLETQMDDVKETQTAILQKLDALTESMTKYKGFVGGIMFTFSALATALGIAMSYWFGKPQ